MSERVKYRLVIITADPDVRYHKNREYNNGNELYATDIESTCHKKVKEKAGRYIEKMLAHDYTDWNAVPAELMATQEGRTKAACDPQYKDYSIVTHQVDQYSVWLQNDDYEPGSVLKYIYTAYEDDYMGHDRYAAILTPLE